MSHVPSSEAARTRAIKRHLWANEHRFVATCALGAESLLQAEVSALPDVAQVTSRAGGVTFSAPFDTLYTALLTLRCAESLRLLLAADVAAASYPMLHDQLTRVRWSLWLPQRSSLQLRVASRGSRLRDDEGLAHALRGALQHHGLATSESDAPAFTLHLRLEHDRASVTLDLGGQLYRRSSDKWVSRTTIRESTAAALVRLADPASADLVVDPFCGSGTLASEALELTLGWSAGRRRTPPFAASPAWKAERARHALRQANTVPATPPPRVVCRDVDPRAVDIARRNLHAAGLESYVQLEVGASQEFDGAALATAHGAQRPLLLSNPPYGRLAAARGASPVTLLRELLATASGWRFALLFPDAAALEALPHVDIETRLPVVTGGLRNTLVVGSVRSS